LPSRQYQRQFLFRFRQLQFASGIARDAFSLDQKPIEASQRGELQSDIGARLSLFHQAEQIIAKVIGVALLPGSIHTGAEIF
jgi:hypothetical protein